MKKVKFFPNDTDLIIKAIGPLDFEYDTLRRFMVLATVRNLEDFNGGFVGTGKQMYEYTGLDSLTPYEFFIATVQKLVNEDWIQLIPIYNSKGEIVDGKYRWVIGEAFDNYDEG